VSYLGLVVIIQRNGVWGGTGGLSGIFPVGAQGRAKPPIVRVSNRGSEQAILCPAPHSLPHLLLSTDGWVQRRAVGGTIGNRGERAGVGLDVVAFSLAVCVPIVCRRNCGDKSR
jgi:hypothetical protein